MGKHFTDNIAIDTVEPNSPATWNSFSLLTLIVDETLVKKEAPVPLAIRSKRPVLRKEQDTFDVQHIFS